uniref:Macaca fascicularis brain cDNA, clone: QflA-23716 n=1 Tax=Macaca fascicularis TaxID=9541 RepID=I7GP32_MACFA|nr:unnamed protein product [Macaca fascicularis]
MCFGNKTTWRKHSMLMMPLFGFWHNEEFFFFLYVSVFPKLSFMIICDQKKKKKKKKKIQCTF